SILGLAGKLVSEFDGQVPQTMEELLTLPGVARKTANVILGVAYGKADGVVVDTHVKRLTNRLGLTEHADPKKIERDLMELLPRTEWIAAGHLLIWHGRRVCSARKPACDRCLLSDRCPSTT
ncbi:MAG: endonuclease III domain-containing protein, partial [Planctomycetota bacterium]